MKTITKNKRTTVKNKKGMFGGLLASVAAALLMFNTGCIRNDFSSRSYEQVNLVADTQGYHALRVDPTLKNAWGIGLSPTGAYYISANRTGLSDVEDRNGSQLAAAINIPFGENSCGASPTGAVYNGTNSFIIPRNHSRAKLLVATENGTIAGWSAGTQAYTVVNRAYCGAIYKGLTLAQRNGCDYLYAADFHNGRIDVFDGSFNLVSGCSFSDPSLPYGYAPFNIQNIDGELYVTYARQDADREDDVPGAGRGFVDVYDPSGTLLRRFASQGALNAPWGIAKAPSSFGVGRNAILIGNFGDGRINVYDSDGTFERPLRDSRDCAIEIDGLWMLLFPPDANCGDPNRLYFTAGPDDERHGLFGYIRCK